MFYRTQVARVPWSQFPWPQGDKTQHLYVVSPTNLQGSFWVSTEPRLSHDDPTDARPVTSPLPLRIESKTHPLLDSTQQPSSHILWAGEAFMLERSGPGITVWQLGSRASLPTRFATWADAFFIFKQWLAIEETSLRWIYVPRRLRLRGIRLVSGTRTHSSCSRILQISSSFEASGLPAARLGARRRG
jgi:hypothetical protein